MPYIPHTQDDIEKMLASIKAQSSEALFDEIPQELLQSELKKIPLAQNEMTMLKDADRLAKKNQNGLCFIGAGSYEHHIPAAVWDIASRGEFLTAYTPYQAEASQGTLQLLYEFQTMIAELTGMEVANASLYDGASALAEAVLMAARIQREQAVKRVLVAGTIHPHYRETLDTIVFNREIEVIYLPFDKQAGRLDLEVLKQYQAEEITALVIQQPNFFGCLEQVDAMTDWAHAKQALVIASVNPISLGLLKAPGQWGTAGADIVCGEGQPFGCPLASGGPYFGFFSSKMQFVRQIPGRLIGQTVDKEGKRGFSLTLQAREQHIRREKATSNICTNQGLLVTAATIHMSLLGPQGLKEVASRCYQNSHNLVLLLSEIPGVKTVFSAPYFHEALIQFNCSIENVIHKLHQAGIEGGLPCFEYYPEFPNSLLVCATEMRTEEDIAYYAKQLKQIMLECSSVSEESNCCA